MHLKKSRQQQLDWWQERVDLAATFRWTERLALNEAVANHFSLAINPEGTKFLMNPNQMYFGRIRASDLLVIDANDPQTMERPDAPDPTAWGLHGSIHRNVPHARCIMHLHPPFSTTLACLADSTLPPIDQTTAMFYGRVVIDDQFGGLAFESEGERCAKLLTDPKVKVLLMGNHGVLVIGQSVADAFNQIYYFERAAANYIRALQTGQKLRVLSHEIAEKTSSELENYPGHAYIFLSEIKAMLDEEGSSYAS